MAETQIGNKEIRKLPTPKGKLSSKYVMESKLGFGRGPNLFVLDTVENSIKQVKSLMTDNKKKFDPQLGLTTFACADAIDERCVAEYYLPHKIKMIRDGMDTIPATHYPDLHFYDLHMDYDEEEYFNTIGNAHETDIFDALTESGEINADTPKASLFFLKGIRFFESGNCYSDNTGKKIEIFQRNLPNFLNDVALVFITADDPALKNVPGFTQIHTDDIEVEKESRLDIYLYQKPETETIDQ